MAATNSAPTIVFDLDGTLVETAHDLLAALNAALTDHGLEPAPAERLRSYVGQGGEMMIRRVFAERQIPLEDDRLKALLARFIEAYEADMPGLSQPFPGVMDLVDNLRAAGCRTAICTNKYQRLTDRLISRMGLADHFDAICGADAFPVRKPDPLHLFGTIERAGGDVASAVMIGDSVTDIKTAQNAGLPSVVVTFGYSDVDVHTLGATQVISAFSELSVRSLLDLAEARP